MRLTIDKAAHYLMASLMRSASDYDSVIMILAYGHTNEGMVSYRYFRSGL